MRLAFGLILLALVVPAAAQAADTPTARTLYADGPEGRYLMEGDWLFRLDPSDRGAARALLPAAQHGRLDDRRGPARVERRRRLGGLDERLDRLVPQGLRVAERERRARLGGALRVGQLPRDGVAERQEGRLERRRLPAVHGAAEPGQPPRHQPARRPRRLPPRPRRPPARPYQPAHAIAHRRLVELRRDPARGLPPAHRHAAVPVRDREPAARVRDVRCDGRDGDAAAQRRRPRAPRHRDRDVRGPHRQAGHAHDPRREDRELPRLLHARRPASVGAARPVPVPGRDRGPRRQPAGRALDGQQRRALGQGLGRSPAAQRPAGERARRRRARGQPGAGLRGRQHVAALARRPCEGARRVDAAHALPDAPLHPRAGGPRGPADLVRDSRLRPEDLVHRRHHAARAEAAAQEHRDQREPSVGADLVDRQRALVQAGTRPRARTSAGPRSSPISSIRRGRSASRSPAIPARAASAATGRSTSSASTTTSAGIRGRAAPCSTATSCPRTSTRCAPAIRATRS